MSKGRFQSLVGFKINWNLNPCPHCGNANEFQSLVGFKINWNYCADAGGVSSGKFQSLVGFKINWNRKDYQEDGIWKKVSIPSRV